VTRACRAEASQRRRATFDVPSKQDNRKAVEEKEIYPAEQNGLTRISRILTKPRRGDR